MRDQQPREYKGQRVLIQFRAGGNHPGNASVTLVINIDGQEVFRGGSGMDGMGQDTGMGRVEALAVTEVAKVRDLGEEGYIAQFDAEAI
jgi:hypothetical protein